MTKLTLPIGKEEQHNVDVTASVFGGAEVRVDGKPVSAFNMPGRLKMVKLYVGEKESHELEVRVRGLLLHKIEILIDGKTSGQG